MFPDLPSLPSDEAFLHELGTSCGAEVSGFGANGKDDASGAAGWAFFGQFIAHDVTADRSPLMDRADIEALKNVRRQKLNLEFLYGSGPTGDPYRVSRPDWRPELPSRVAGRFTMADLLGFVGETRDLGRTPEQVRP